LNCVRCHVDYKLNKFTVYDYIQTDLNYIKSLFLKKLYKGKINKIVKHNFGLNTKIV